MNHKQRINDLNMTMYDVFLTMSEGVPGGLAVLCNLDKEGGRIDPDNTMGGFGNILDLDALGVYGSRIWMLYKDVCEESIGKVVLVLRGWQLGCILESQINDAIDCGGKIDFVLLGQKVKERLPRFKLESGECNESQISSQD